MFQSETKCEAISHLRISHNAPCSLPRPPPPAQKLDNLCFSFLLSITAVPRETQDNDCAKCGGRRGGGGGKQGVLWEMCKWQIDQPVLLLLLLLLLCTLHPLMTSKREAVTSISALKSVFAIRSPRSQRFNHHLLTVPVIDTKRTE